MYNKAAAKTDEHNKRITTHARLGVTKSVMYLKDFN